MKIAAKTPTVDYASIVNGAFRLGATELFLNEMAPALWSAAVDYGIDPVGVIGQSGHETGWGKFGRATRPWHRNTCGLKIYDYRVLTEWGLDSEHPLAHAQYATWEMGAVAHCQHLWAYMGKSVPRSELVDPRYVHIDQTRPVTEYRELSSRWAGAGYGDRVENAIARLIEEGQ
jgi:hypothetical protein